MCSAHVHVCTPVDVPIATCTTITTCTLCLSMWCRCVWVMVSWWERSFDWKETWQPFRCTRRHVSIHSPASVCVHPVTQHWGLCTRVLEGEGESKGSQVYMYRVSSGKLYRGGGGGGGSSVIIIKGGHDQMKSTCTCRWFLL